MDAEEKGVNMGSIQTKLEKEWPGEIFLKKGSSRDLVKKYRKEYSERMRGNLK